MSEHQATTLEACLQAFQNDRAATLLIVTYETQDDGTPYCTGGTGFYPVNQQESGTQHQRLLPPMSEGQAKTPEASLASFQADPETVLLVLSFEKGEDATPLFTGGIGLIPDEPPAEGLTLSKSFMRDLINAWRQHG